MKKISAIITFLAAALAGMAQQDAHYSFFPYNHQYVNPAFVGSRNTASFTGIHRSQWLGFEGAPSSQLLSFQTPVFRQRAGVGGTMFRQTIGVSENWALNGAYSYNLRLTQEIDLRLGLMGSIEYLGIDFADEKVVTVSQNDPSLADNEYASEYAANVGLGMFATYKEMFYFGASSPQIYPNEIGFNRNSLVTAEVFPHRYLMTGAVFALSEQFDLMPNLLVKWVDHAPLAADLNVSLRYMNKVTGGLTYRPGGNKSGESVDLLLFFQFTQKLAAGLAYDLTLSDIRDYQSGSIEVLLRYDLRDEKGNLENPRYFKKK